MAFLSIFLDQILHKLYFDPIASILTGVLLTAVAVLLARESGALLVGERANRSKIKRIREIISREQGVETIGDLLTMQLGPKQVLLAVDIKFHNGIRVEELESIIDRLESRIRKSEPTVKRIFIEVEALTRSSNPASNTAGETCTAA